MKDTIFGFIFMGSDRSRRSYEASVLLACTLDSQIELWVITNQNYFFFVLFLM